jgi:acetyl esterase/lipase
VIPLPVSAFVARLLLGLPGLAQRWLAGEPIRIDGQQLATEAQLILRLRREAGRDLSIAQARRRMRTITGLVSGRRIEPVQTKELTIGNAASTIGARLYQPDRLAGPSPLLVYYHGGGWVEGDLETHDNVCRFLALHGGTRVLAVDYRLAPEHPFPAAVNDALATFRYAAEHAEELGADPAALAVGGDSAGGNLAVVVARLAAADQRPPVFQLLIYPGTDAVELSTSRRLFGEGFLLTEERIQQFLDWYLPHRDDRRDPRASPLYEPHLHLLPPTYLATAGFDPLRDEGELLATRIAEAGVPVVLRRFDDLYHGFANVIGIGRHGREAMFEIAGALRVGLALGRVVAQQERSTVAVQSTTDQQTG